MAKPAKNLIERLLSSFMMNKDCWECAIIDEGTGYGRLHARQPKNKQVYAHREMYKLFTGDIPKRMQVDHHCRNRRCINPEHLELVTPKENLMRSDITHASINKAKTKCINGHKFTKNNISRRRDRPNSRGCKTCLKETNNKFAGRRIKLSLN